MTWLLFCLSIFFQAQSCVVKYYPNPESVYIILYMLMVVGSAWLKKINSLKKTSLNSKTKKTATKPLGTENKRHKITTKKKDEYILNKFCNKTSLTDNHMEMHFAPKSGIQNNTSSLKGFLKVNKLCIYILVYLLPFQHHNDIHRSINEDCSFNRRVRIISSFIPFY